MAKAKKCAKCGVVFPKEEIHDNFGKSDTSCDSYQSYCNKCKNNLGKRRRQKNVSARLRHHIATRVNAQLGELCPDNHTANLDKLLGYSLRSLKLYLADELRSREGPDRKLKDALEEGYHIDHVHPLSKFQVITTYYDPNLMGTGHEAHLKVDWDEFRKCWSQKNLMAIPAEENLAKGAKVQ